MATKHYLSYLQETIRSHWDGLAMSDLDGEHRYTYAQLAAEIEKLHELCRSYEVGHHGKASEECRGVAFQRRSWHHVLSLNR